MARKRTPGAAPAAPAARKPAPRTVRGFRFTVAHRHAGHDYQPGDLAQLTAADARAIRAFAGASALVETAPE